MIEVMVAATILVVIVMMLGMLFQQTSVAWRTGADAQRGLHAAPRLHRRGPARRQPDGRRQPDPQGPAVQRPEADIQKRLHPVYTSPEA
jgi:hypothetical protein